MILIRIFNYLFKIFNSFISKQTGNISNITSDSTFEFLFLFIEMKSPYTFNNVDKTLIISIVRDYIFTIPLSEPNITKWFTFHLYSVSESEEILIQKIIAVRKGDDLVLVEVFSNDTIVASEKTSYVITVGDCAKLNEFINNSLN